MQTWQYDGRNMRMTDAPSSAFTESSNKIGGFMCCRWLIFCASFTCSFFPFALKAQGVPFICTFKYDDGEHTTKLFSIDVEAETSDIGSFVSINENDDSVMLTWESLNCETQRKAPHSSIVCQNNYMFLDRRTLEARGDLNGRSFSAACIIGEIDRKF